MELTLISARLNNYIHHKVWDEITYPLPNFNSFAVEIWEWINTFILHFTGQVISYPCWDLTHWGQVTHLFVSKLRIIGSDNGLSQAPSHYLNQCWNIVNWNLRNKLQWKFGQNSNIFIQENALENVVCEMSSILSQPQCVKSIYVSKRGPWCPADARSHIINIIYIVLA